MSNNIKELIKLREISNSQFSSREKNKSEISNSLDQEIIQNYKLQNTKLTEEINSLTRNFEALCLKNKEDNNLIKKLEEEINFYKSKIKKTQMNSEKFEEDKNSSIQSLKEKIEFQNDLIRNFETKIQNFSTLSSKAQEKENFYKNYSNKLDEKNKNLILSNENSEKEISKLRKELKFLKESKEEENSLLNEKNEKFKKEKELAEKLLIESRDRIKFFEKKNEEIILKYDQKIENELNKFKEVNEKMRNKMEEENENFKEIKNKLEDEIKKVKIDLNLRIDDINFYKNEIKKKNEEIENLKKSQNEILNQFELTNKNFLVENMNSNFTKVKNNLQNEFYLRFEKFTKELESAILEKLFRNEKLLKSLQISIVDKFSKIKHQNQFRTSFYFESIKNLNDKHSQLQIKYTEQDTKEKILISKLHEEISELKSLNNLKEESLTKISHERDAIKFSVYEKEKSQKNQISYLEKKFDKKRIKLLEIRKENDKIKNEIKSLKQSFFESKEEIQNKFKNLFIQVKSISEKLKLSFDTLLLILPCKSCSNLEKKLNQMECGHSLCKDCADKLILSKKPCIECHNSVKHSNTQMNINNFNIPSLIENKNLNDIIVRIQFINQLIYEIEMIKCTIEELFRN